MPPQSGTDVAQKAILGEVHGSAELYHRRRGPTEREWRGTFAFRAEDEAVVADLADARGTVPLHTLIDGRPARLDVFVTTITPDGLAYFEAKGDVHGTLGV
jgi:hypothetical protein